MWCFWLDYNDDDDDDEESSSCLAGQEALV